jgi:alginate O-acetyltransferase complex protein AlgI
MAVCSLAFLFFCAAVSIVYHLAPGKWLRQLILACASGLFLAPLVPDLRSWVWFAVALAGTYVALVLVRARPRGRVVVAAVTLVLLLYLYLKRYRLLAEFIPFEIIPFPLAWDMRLHPVELVGLSYMAFKIIHMLVDQWQGQLAPFNLWTYLNYQLSFFTLTAGPIQRYNDFLRYWEEIDLKPSDMRESLLFWIRILTGMIKVGLIGAYTESVFHSAAGLHRTSSDALTVFYAFPIYLYFNFSGYTDIVLGAAGLLGFRLPENFNRPWLARNVLDFWDRWHMSLTHWIRDYVFMASYKVAATNFPSAARYWGYVLLFLAMFLACVWHGATDGFVIFGVLNGLGAAATRVYGDVLRATLGRSGLHAYMHNRTVRIFAIMINLHYVGVSLLFFNSDINRAQAILRGAVREIAHLPTTVFTYSWEGMPVAIEIALLLFVLVLLTAAWKFDAFSVFIARLALRFSTRNGWLLTILCVQCAIVVEMFFFDWAFQQEPPPVLYMAF